MDQFGRTPLNTMTENDLDETLAALHQQQRPPPAQFQSANDGPGPLEPQHGMETILHPSGARGGGQQQQRGAGPVRGMRGGPGGRATPRAPPVTADDIDDAELQYLYEGDGAYGGPNTRGTQAQGGPVSNLPPPLSAPMTGGGGGGGVPTAATGDGRERRVAMSNVTERNTNKNRNASRGPHGASSKPRANAPPNSPSKGGGGGSDKLTRGLSDSKFAKE